MASHRHIRFAAVLAMLSATSGIGQNNAMPNGEALIMIYSNHMTLLGGTLGHQWGAFKGRFFDGEKQLAFIEPAHFVTFRIPVGEHIFTAGSWMSKNSKKGAHTKVTIEGGHRYFIECGSFAGAPAFGIREVTCHSAQPVGMGLKPLEAAHLRAAGRLLVIPESSFPDCSIANSP